MDPSRNRAENQMETWGMQLPQQSTLVPVYDDAKDPATLPRAVQDQIPRQAQANK